jgi:hypothetical protein
MEIFKRVPCDPPNILGISCFKPTVLGLFIHRLMITALVPLRFKL